MNSNILSNMTNKEIIKKQVELLRKGYNIGIYPNEIEKLCTECDLENDKFTLINNIPGYASINLLNFGIKEPYHRASLIGFNTVNGPEWFLVDPTYGQFFENETFKNYMIENHEDFSINLLKEGFIECTLSNIVAYFNGFVFSNAFTTDININEVYDKLENFLITNKIVNKDIIEQSTNNNKKR